MGEILTIHEAAARLKLKPQTVRDWVRLGKLPAAKLGRVWRIDADDLEAFLQAAKRSDQHGAERRAVKGVTP